MKRFRLWALLALATALFTAASVSPAAASDGHDHEAGAAYCEPGEGQFNSLNRLVTSTVGVDKRREPRLAERGAPGAGPTSKWGRGRSGGKFSESIDVYFHVIHDGDGGRVSEKQVREQIRVMNKTYAGKFGGAKAGFKFKLKKIDYTDNAFWFNALPLGFDNSTHELDMKTALHRGGMEDLNIYSTNGGGMFLGWAYFAEDIIAAELPEMDGVVVHHLSLPGAYAWPYDLGYTATHETGHWLGLYHPFDFGCLNHGDLVEDTPEQDFTELVFGCSEGADTCPQPGLDPIHNFMGYSDDACMTEFTRGQVERMRGQWDTYREQGRGDDGDDRDADRDDD